MNTTTKMRSAEACALSVRLPRLPSLSRIVRVDQVLLAPVAAGDQGIALTIVTPTAIVRRAALDSVFTGVVRGATDVSFAYKTSDVVRSLPGRPPV